VGVTILAILDFIGAAVFAIVAILAFVSGGTLAAAISRQQGTGPLAAFMGAGAVVFGVGLLIGAAIYALIGWGLWGVKNWARIVTIVFAALWAALTLLGLVSQFTIGGVIGLAIDALIIWYLLKPDVAGAFKGTQSAAASA